MITEWPHHGIWGDSGTPVHAATFVPLVGAWASYVIDVTEGVEHLGEVTDGHLYWDARLPQGSEMVADVLVNDTGEWQRGLVRGEPILRAREWNNVTTPTVRIRVRIFTTMGDVRPPDHIAVRELAVVLSRRGSMAWKSPSAVRIGWRDDG